MVSRRSWLALVMGGAALGVARHATAALPRLSPGEAPRVMVYKSATCGCCGNWVRHLEEHGFEVEVENVADVSEIKNRYGVPAALFSCHTGIIDGYVVEGHVPAEDVERLLRERPEAIGIAVPGMPVGSPGMEVGDRRDPYQVVAFDRDGKSWTFARH